MVKIMITTMMGSNMLKRYLRVRKIIKLMKIVSGELSFITDIDNGDNAMEAQHVVDTLRFRNKLIAEYNALKFPWQKRMFMSWPN